MVFFVSSLMVSRTLAFCLLCFGEKTYSGTKATADFCHIDEFFKHAILTFSFMATSYGIF